MRRLHLFEFEDLDWFPAALRDMMTEYLRTASGLMGRLPVLAAERLAPVLRRAPRPHLVDLGSGGGGILPEVLRVLEQEHGLEVRATLTDRYPNPDALGRLCAQAPARLAFRAGPVDARDVPAELEGVRTLFLSLHHFRPDQARAILADAARHGAPIAAFEFTDRSWGALLAVLPGIPLMVWALTPFIRPFRWRRLLLTYAVPLLPLLILWDGIVSHLRTYRPEELEALARGLGGPGWRWEVRRERVPGAPAYWTSLVGAPAPSAR